MKRSKQREGVKKILFMDTFVNPPGFMDITKKVVVFWRGRRVGEEGGELPVRPRRMGHGHFFGLFYV